MELNRGDLLPEPDELGEPENAKVVRAMKFAVSCFFGFDFRAKAETQAGIVGGRHMYEENTSKEELALEHVLEYQRQFKIIYDPVRDLLLAPKNECGKRKFICSTIRPSKMPFTQLYDYATCAEFVSNYLEYEEL